MGLLYVKVYKVLEHLILVKKCMQYCKVQKFSLVKSFPTRNYSILLQALPPLHQPPPQTKEGPRNILTYITTENGRENKYLRREK